EGTIVDALERSNNPARMALTVREQVEARLAEAKQEWQLQWDGDRKRLRAEIERLKKQAPAAGGDDKKEAARRALLEKLGKLPARPVGSAAKSADQWEREFEEAKIGWETERSQLKLRVTRLETDLQHAQCSLRDEILQE